MCFSILIENVNRFKLIFAISYITYPHRISSFTRYKGSDHFTKAVKVCRAYQYTVGIFRGHVRPDNSVD